ncbi:MAG: hypothetical protein ACRDU5_21655 [Mycobacterium sp.]
MAVYLLFTVMTAELNRAAIAHVSYRFYAVWHSNESFRRQTMWMIELNFAGYQFTHRVADHRLSMFRFTPRIMGWRPAPLRNPHAA